MEFSGISDEAGRDIETQVRAHTTLGWGLIELRNVDGKCVTDATDADFDRILGCVVDAGLQVSCVSSQIGNWSRMITGDFEIDLAELRRAIPRLHHAGTKFTRIMSWRQGDATRDDWRREAIRRISELAKIAEDGGIVLAHEVCTGWGSEGAAELLELLASVDSPALTVLWDTGNPLKDGRDMRPFLAGVKDRVEYVHIKDWVLPTTTVGGHGAYPGEGQSEVPYQLTELFRVGYDGVISIEPHVASIIHEGKEGDPDITLKTYVEYGRRLEKLVTSLKSQA